MQYREMSGWNSQQTTSQLHQPQYYQQQEQQKYTVKPGFHYPRKRPELTARVDGVDGRAFPTRPVN